MSISKKITNSASELKNVYSLAALAMLLSLRVVLGFFANGTLAFFGNSVKLSGAFLPLAVSGVMFGPIPAALVGALGDVLSFLLNPSGGAFFPGFTLNGVLTGLIYGLFFYKSGITASRVILARFTNALVVETFLSAYWLYFLLGGSSGDGYEVYLIARLVSEAVKFAPEIILITTCGKLSAKIKLPGSLKAS